MKKFTFIMVAAIAISMASCTAQSPKPSLKNDIDTLSYNFGLARTQGLSDYLLSLGVDSTQKKNFIEGFLKGAQNLSMADLAHAAGIQVGQQVAKSWVDGLNQQLFSADSTQTVNVNDLIAGFVAGYMGNPTDEQLTLASNIVDMKMKALQDINNEKLYGANREAGEKFLAENKIKEGVQTTASGLQYKVIKEGKGAIPTKDDKVRVLYTGKTIDGNVFDSTANRNNEPATFGVGQVIAGWTEALTMMPVGSKWEVYIPQELGYGAKGAGSSIEPYSALIFEVELLGIEK